jgi:hypothetical protein
VADQSHVQKRKSSYVIRDANKVIKQHFRVLGEYGRPKLTVKKLIKAGSTP